MNHYVVIMSQFGEDSAIIVKANSKRDALVASKRANIGKPIKIYDVVTKELLPKDAYPSLLEKSLTEAEQAVAVAKKFALAEGTMEAFAAYRRAQDKYENLAGLL